MARIGGGTGDTDRTESRTTDVSRRTRDNRPTRIADGQTGDTAAGEDDPQERRRRSSRTGSEKDVMPGGDGDTSTSDADDSGGPTGNNRPTDLPVDSTGGGRPSTSPLQTTPNRPTVDPDPDTSTVDDPLQDQPENGSGGPPRDNRPTGYTASQSALDGSAIRGDLDTEPNRPAVDTSVDVPDPAENVPQESPPVETVATGVEEQTPDELPDDIDADAVQEDAAEIQNAFIEENPGYDEDDVTVGIVETADGEYRYDPQLTDRGFNKRTQAIAADFEQRLKSQTGADLEPGDDFTIERQGDQLVPQLTEEGRAQVAAADLDERAYSDVDVGDVRQTEDGTYGLTDAAAADEQTAIRETVPDEYRGMERAAAADAMSDRMDAVGSRYEQRVEQQFGVDLEEGEDYVVGREDDQLVPRLTDQGRADVAAAQVEASAGQPAAAVEAATAAASDVVGGALTGEIAAEETADDITTSLTGDATAAREASPLESGQDFTVSVDGTNASIEPLRSYELETAQLSDEAAAEIRDGSDFDGRTTVMTEAMAEQRLREQGYGDLVPEQEGYAEAAIDAAVDLPGDTVEASEAALGWTQENVVRPTAEVSGDVAGVAQEGLSYGLGFSDDPEAVRQATLDVVRAPADEQYDGGLVESGTEKVTEGAGTALSTVSVGLPMVAETVGRTGYESGEYTATAIGEEGLIGGSIESGQAAAGATYSFAQSEAERAVEQPFRFAGEAAGGALLGGGIGKAASGTRLVEGRTGAAIRRVDVGTRTVRRGRAEARGILGRETDDLARDSYVARVRNRGDDTPTAVRTGREQVGTGGYGTTLDADDVDAAMGVSGPSVTSRVRGEADRLLGRQPGRGVDADTTTGAPAQSFMGDERGQLGGGGQRGTLFEPDSSPDPPEFTGYDPDPPDAGGSFEDVRQDALTQSQDYLGGRPGRPDPGDYERTPAPFGRDAGDTIDPDTGEIDLQPSTPPRGSTVEPADPVSASLRTDAFGAQAGTGIGLLDEAQRSEVLVEDPGPPGTIEDTRVSTTVAPEEFTGAQLRTGSAETEEMDLLGPSIETAVASDVTQDTRPELTPDATPDTSPDATPDVTPDVTPDTRPDTTPDVTPDTRPDTTPDVTPDITPDPRPQPTPGTTPDTTPDPSPDPTPDPSPDPTPDPRPNLGGDEDDVDEMFESIWDEGEETFSTGVASAEELEEEFGL